MATIEKTLKRHSSTSSSKECSIHLVRPARGINLIIGAAFGGLGLVYAKPIQRHL
jgi:hypothetical protein